MFFPARRWQSACAANLAHVVGPRVSRVCAGLVGRVAVCFRCMFELSEPFSTECVGGAGRTFSPLIIITYGQTSFGSRQPLTDCRRSLLGRRFRRVAGVTAGDRPRSCACAGGIDFAPQGAPLRPFRRRWVRPVGSVAGCHHHRFAPGQFRFWSYVRIGCCDGHLARFQPLKSGFVRTKPVTQAIRSNTRPETRCRNVRSGARYRRGSSRRGW